MPPVEEIRPNNPKQEAFLSLPDDIFEAGYGGANGGGKTWALIAYPILRGFHEYPSFHGVIFRKTNKELESSVEPRAKEFYEKVGATYNHTSKLFTFKSKARIRLSYLETMDHAKDHDTNEYNYAAFEELTHFLRDPYMYVAFSRVRSSSNLPSIVRNAMTPGNVGHRWVYDRFIKYAPKGFKKLRETPTNSAGEPLLDPFTKEPVVTTRIFIPAFGIENPDLVKNDPGYFHRLMMLPEAERRAKLEGDWNAFSGQVFDEFRIRPGFGEPEIACHIEDIDEDQIPSYWPKIIAVDWGFRHFTFVLWGAIDEYGVVHIYREHVVKGQKIREWAADVSRKSRLDENIVVKVIDPSAMQERGQDFTIYEQFCMATGWNDVELADNDRIGGKELLHEFLRWKARPPRYVPLEGFSQERYNYIYRNFGEKASIDYRMAFIPDPGDPILPKLKISSRCTELIDVIPQCAYDDGLSQGKSKEDVAKFDGDDGYDCVRYLLKAAQRYLDYGKKGQGERVAISKIVSNLQNSGDWSGYYRQMELIESRKKAQSGPVVHRMDS